jgi:predicted  nucleic acid-binding Zn-ribbon protein
LNEQLKLLIKLQETDSSILSIADRIESLPRRLDKPKDFLKESNAIYQKTRVKHEELNGKKKGKEQELEEIQDKINKLKTRSGEIKTNKEYEAHLKEIEAFEKNKYLVEDEMLSVMEDIEAITGVLREEETEVKKAEEEFRKQEKEIEEEKKKLQHEMGVYKGDRKETVPLIDVEIYDQYMNILKKYREKAIVPAENEVCLGCNTNIPPQLYNDIREKDKIITCFYCKRFLYYKEK